MPCFLNELCLYIYGFISMKIPRHPHHRISKGTRSKTSGFAPLFPLYSQVLNLTHGDFTCSRWSLLVTLVILTSEIYSHHLNIRRLECHNDRFLHHFLHDLSIHLCYRCSTSEWELIVKVEDYKGKTDAERANEWEKEIWGETGIGSVGKERNQLRWSTAFSGKRKKLGEIFCTPWYLSP